MAKATHLGTCQLCGREQKLPGGTLSTHGYTVEWSMFLGTCPGTGYLPFEQSTDRIQAAIVNSRVYAERFDELYQQWLGETVKVAFQRHVPATGYGRSRQASRDEWVIVHRHAVSDDLRFWTDDKGVRHQTAYYGGRSLDALVQEKNGRYAATFAADAAKHREYIVWQQARIKDWKPSALKPVLPEARPAGECSGSRALSGDYQRRYVRCPVCQKTVSNDYRSGRIRSHKPD